ncbi:MAG: glutathione S-transferase N-terminal domain-containing protein [Methylobacteriaceae bacterium]|nr:glutathione S-transferase N-terminal domain-containing protein [Methylobacteriaceae bacterium]
MTDLKLYYSPGSCSLAPHIALEEAGADFEPVRVDMRAAEQRSPAYLALNPKGRVPTLVDRDLIVTENPAVLRYVARRFPEAGLWPEAADEEARCLEWLAWIASTVHPAYAHVRRPERYAGTEAGRGDVVSTGLGTVRDLWGQVEARLAARRGAWAAGESFSVADPYLFVFWHWGRSSVLGYDMAADFPAWTDHARRLVARDGATRALARENISPP